MRAEVQHAVAFADGAGGGNPCPVVFGAEDWTDAQLQAAAAAFGHETCFVLDPTADEALVRLRYFVPNHEMEMCVHATVAAAVVLVLPDDARDDLEATGVYAFTTDARGADAAARQFPVRAGYDDDPATGVAARVVATRVGGTAAAVGGREPLAAPSA